MRSETPRYPVDRYLVESSKTIEMVNIADDELWNPEPAIRPEDEIILRKLHEMLQSTADDLKLISGELIKCREPRVQVKTLPTPLDEEFNEKVHIEEIVNAKFHGYKIIEKSPHKIFEKDVKNNIDSVPTKPIIKTVNAAVELLQMPTVKKSSTKKNLVRSRTNNLVIEEQPKIDLERVKLNNVKDSTSVPSVSYSEFSHVEPKVKFCPQKPLNIQEMPSINIRSELKEQKVLQLDIIPEQKGNTENLSVQSNVAVITMQHEPAPRAEKSTIPNYQQAHSANSVVNKPSVRRVSKIMTCESSESSNNVTSEAQDRIITQKLFKSSVRSSPKPSAQFDSRVSMGSKFNKNEERRSHRNIDEWNKKLNTIYGRTSTSKRNKTRAKSTMSSKKCSPLPVRKNNGSQSLLNNAEYIPYAKLTLGGVRVSDIEREISDIPDKTNIPLNPILDKILISRENSINSNSPKRKEEKRNTNILTTSDENLLEEVLDIERNVATTLSKNLKLKEKTPSQVSSNISTENSGSDKASYADDFEEERSENGQLHSDQNKSRNHQTDNIQENNTNEIKTNIQNSTITKSSNLSFKKSVEVFEFIHSIDTQESATQSNAAHKISLKATQTSPRNVQPIRNDLWPSNDQANEGDKVMKEDFIKKLIVDECTDILQKNLTKFSTFEDNGNEKKNFSATQKNTQTSPAHVKSVMTSPTKTKTRSTSPFTLSLGVDHQTSPIVIVDSEEDFHIELDKVDDLAISINLSSPRFSLRLPQTSREVISNLDATFSKLDYKLDNKTKALKSLRKLSSLSSADADYSSSDISSLGEINNKFKRRLRKTKIPTISESSASSTTSKYSSDLSSVIVPLTSEGEISFGQIDKGKTRLIRSDGEVSLGRT